jgi:eukaryotic-like serine/threonine-protein kinase
MVPDEIGPYRITARLGAGGMGEVYRAYDERLDRAVAIKFIHSRRRDDDSAHERFRREARIVARLKHPAIPPVYDVLRWEDGECLVMELVEGETLAAILRPGPLKVAAALKLFRQIADGLAAAHAKGIVHRDLKSSNVMVTPEGDAKILDFGLAKSLGLSESPLSVEGGLLGTFHCMSPEQAQGLEIDHRSDLFSLGALIYETLTGLAPFRGENLQETLARVYKHRQKPAHVLDPAIPLELSRLVERLLQKEPDQRPQSADEVVAVLAGIEASSASGGLSFAARRAAADESQPRSATTVVSAMIPANVARRLQRWTPTVVAAAALALLSLVLMDPATGPATDVAPAAQIRPAVAVVGFEDLSPRAETDWLSTAMAEVLASQLAAGGAIRTVPGQRVSRVRHDLGWDSLTAISKELRDGLEQNLEASFFVLGEVQIAADDGLLHVKVRLYDTHSGFVLAEHAETGSPRQLFQLLSAAADVFREKLGTAALSPAQAVGVKALLPSDPEAMRPYARGLEELRRSQAREATRWLTEAVQVDPERPALTAALTEAFAELGEDQLTRRWADRTRKLLDDPSAEVPARPRLELEARLSVAVRDWKRAIESLEPLYRSAPDELDNGLQLAEARIETSQIDEARAILDELGRLPPPTSQDPRIDLLRARVHQGSPGDVARFARRAAERAGEIGARSLAARALLTEAGALQDLGEDSQAAQAADQSRRTFEALGDRKGAAKILELQAIAASMRGQLDVAGNLYRGAEDIYRGIGSPRDLARLLVNQGILQSQRGSFDGAEALYEEALAIYEEIGAESERATTLFNLGSTFHQAAELTQALDRYQEAFDLFSQLGHEQGKAAVLTNIAEVHFLRGELDRAEDLHQEAMAKNIASGEEPGRLYDLYRLGDVAAARGDGFVARKRYAEALAGMEEGEDLLGAADARAALAAVELLDGELEAAEKHAGQAEEVARSEGATDVRVRALIVVGGSLLAQNRIPEAQAVAAEIERLVASSTSPRSRFQAATFAARARAASGRRQDVDSALAALEQVVAATAEHELMPDHFEARLAQVEIGLVAGVSNAGDERDALIREAGEKGFDGIVERVERLAPL